MYCDSEKFKIRVINGNTRFITNKLLKKKKNH